MRLDLGNGGSTTSVTLILHTFIVMYQSINNDKMKIIESPIVKSISRIIGPLYPESSLYVNRIYGYMQV